MHRISMALPSPIGRSLRALRQAQAGTAYLLQGDAEKEVAAKLKLSRHTVHRYTQVIYGELNVHSRGELLAKHAQRTSPGANAISGSEPQQKVGCAQSPFAATAAFEYTKRGGGRQGNLPEARDELRFVDPDNGMA